MRIYYIVMKILFAAISIVAAAAAVAFAVLAAAKRRKAHVFQAAVCCCILAISAAGWCFTPPRSPVGGTGEVHVTVSPVSGEPATNRLKRRRPLRLLRALTQRAQSRISFICPTVRLPRAYPMIIAYGFRRATRQLPPDIFRAESANRKTQLIAR